MTGRGIRTAVAFAAGLAVLLAIGATAYGFAGEPATLTRNGDFEQPPAPVGLWTTYYQGTTLSGWHVVGSIDLVNTYWPAAHGAQSVDLNGLSTGGLWRWVNTIPGHPYQLQFMFAGNPDTICGDQGVKRLVVKAGSTEGSYTFDTSGKTLQHIGWVPRNFHFVAHAVLTKLSFLSRSSSCAGPTIDFVRLAPPG
jgi:choice-of-anchor C domain-containing protein